MQLLPKGYVLIPMRHICQPSLVRQCPECNASPVIFLPQSADMPLDKQSDSFFVIICEKWDYFSGFNGP